jgi:PPE-repeat protein
MDSYCLEIENSGSFALLAYLGTANPTTLASGSLSKFDPTSPHALGLSFAGPLISASVDGVGLASVEDTQIGVGNILIGGGWHGIAFDDVRVD